MSIRAHRQVMINQMGFFNNIKINGGKEPEPDAEYQLVLDMNRIYRTLKTRQDLKKPDLGPIFALLEKTCTASDNRIEPTGITKRIHTFFDNAKDALEELYDLTDGNADYVSVYQVMNSWKSKPESSQDHYLSYLYRALVDDGNGEEENILLALIKEGFSASVSTLNDIPFLSANDSLVVDAYIHPLDGALSSGSKLIRLSLIQVGSKHVTNDTDGFFNATDDSRHFTIYGPDQTDDVLPIDLVKALTGINETDPEFASKLDLTQNDWVITEAADKFVMIQKDDITMGFHNTSGTAANTIYMDNARISIE